MAAERSLVPLPQLLSLEADPAAQADWLNLVLEASGSRSFRTQHARKGKGVGCGGAGNVLEDLVKKMNGSAASADPAADSRRLTPAKLRGLFGDGYEGSFDRLTAFLKSHLHRVSLNGTNGTGSL